MNIWLALAITGLCIETVLIVIFFTFWRSEKKKNKRLLEITDEWKDIANCSLNKANELFEKLEKESRIVSRLFGLINDDILPHMLTPRRKKLTLINTYEIIYGYIPGEIQKMLEVQFDDVLEQEKKNNRL